MDLSINPFQHLYFADDAQSSQEFVKLFSPEVLRSAINPVFQGANVVLLGTQGCGKSMILSLLRPEIRLAYAEAGRSSEFPLEPHLRNFVSCGINISRSRIGDLVNASLGDAGKEDLRELPLHFADLFNYWIVHDLLRSVELVGTRSDVFGPTVDLSRINDCVSCISAQDCWFGALDGVSTLPELRQKLEARILMYRRWMNGNLADGGIDYSIRSTKSNMGEPVARTAQCLRETGVISSSTSVLIRVDQIDGLHRGERESRELPERQRALLLYFRMMLNRVFDARDSRVHYRVGSRPYGWINPEFLGVWGSSSILENRRDYLLINMDEELFAIGEVHNSVFRRFASDAFRRRVASAFDREVPPDAARSILGRSPKAQERLDQLSGLRERGSDQQVDRVLGLDAAVDLERWSVAWKKLLRNMFRTSQEGMLDAVLAAAWGRQTGGGQAKREHREDPPPSGEPWRDRKWWRKERLDQAVLQVMTRSQQRFMWWGFEDVGSLSGGNILVFLHLCHRIWDGFQKSQSSSQSIGDDLLSGTTIPPTIQSAAILFASNEWFRKIPEAPGGSARQRFIQVLGVKLHLGLVNDLAMSYPGGTGVSLDPLDLHCDDRTMRALRRFLEESVGFGVLFHVEHASRLKGKGARVKYYLHPSLCPRFQLPEARTKEPRYLRWDEMLKIAGEASVTLEPLTPRPLTTEDGELGLFDEVDQ